MAVVTGTSSLNFSLSQTVSTGVVSTQSLPASFALNVTFANGTGTGAVDLIHAKQYSLVASTPQTIDLTSVLDLSGASINLARVRLFAVVVQDTAAGHVVTVGGGASNPWAPVGTGVVALPCVTSTANSAPVLLYDPYTTGVGAGNVVTSTSKTVKLDPGSNNVVVNVYAFGCSAVS